MCCSPEGVETGGEEGEVEGGRRRERLEVQNWAAGDVVEVNRGERLAGRDLDHAACRVGAESQRVGRGGSGDGERHGVVDEDGGEEAVAGDLHKAGIRGLAVVPPPEMADLAGGYGVEHGTLALKVDACARDMAPAVVVAGDGDGVSAFCRHIVLTPLGESLAVGAPVAHTHVVAGGRLQVLEEEIAAHVSGVDVWQQSALALVEALRTPLHLAPRRRVGQGPGQLYGGVCGHEEGDLAGGLASHSSAEGGHGLFGVGAVVAAPVTDPDLILRVLGEAVEGDFVAGDAVDDSAAVWGEASGAVLDTALGQPEA